MPTGASKKIPAKRELNPKLFAVGPIESVIISLITAKPIPTKSNTMSGLVLTGLFFSDTG